MTGQLVALLAALSIGCSMESALQQDAKTATIEDIIAKTTNPLTTVPGTESTTQHEERMATSEGIRTTMSSDLSTAYRTEFIIQRETRTGAIERATSTTAYRTATALLSVEGIITTTAHPAVTVALSTAVATMTTANPTTTTGSTRSEIKGTWSTWSICSRPCDGGLQTRTCETVIAGMPTATVIQNECTSDSNESRLCNDNFCQVDPLEESYGVYIDLWTSLSTEQYVLVRDQMRKEIGGTIVRFCNNSDNFEICCPDQALRTPLANSQALLDLIVIKRTALPQNDSSLMRLFLVVTANATLAICQRRDSSLTTVGHSAARRSAENEQLYMAPAVLSRLLESGSLSQTITKTIRNQFPNVIVVVATMRPGASAAPLPEISNVTWPTKKSCSILMEFSQKDQQCIYSITFYVTISSPSVAFLIVLVAILSACKLRRRKCQCPSMGGGKNGSGSRGQTRSIPQKQLESGQQRHLAHGARGLDAAHPIIRPDSAVQIFGSTNLDDIYVKTTTFKGASTAGAPSDPAATSQAIQLPLLSSPPPPPPPPLTPPLPSPPPQPLPECRPEEPEECSAAARSADLLG